MECLIFHLMECLIFHLMMGCQLHDADFSVPTNTVIFGMLDGFYSCTRSPGKVGWFMNGFDSYTLMVVHRLPILAPFP
jgi:hypothetical protein